VTLSNEVECDEADVIAGHTGQPEVVKKKGRKGRRRRRKGKGGRGTLEKERPPVFGMIERGGHVVSTMLAKMLQLCSGADEAWLWTLLELASTPKHAQLLSEEQMRGVLKAHPIRRLQAQDVLACLQAPALHVAPGAAEAAQAHCGLLLPCLRVLAEQLRACEQQSTPC
jgi:hypothetical protein